MSSLLKQLCLTKISKCLRAWELVFPHNSRRCSFFLTTLLASLASIFRSRASLGLENLALRHQIGVLHRSAGKRPKLTSGDCLLWICLSRLWRDWRSALAIVMPETVVARHRASFRLFWTWKVRCGKPGRPLKRSPRSDSQDVPGESRLGCTTDPRRTAQTGHRRRAEQCRQIYGALPQTAVSDLAHLPGEPCPAAGLDRLLHRAHHPVPGPLVISIYGEL